MGVQLTIWKFFVSAPLHLHMVIRPQLLQAIREVQIVCRGVQRWGSQPLPPYSLLYHYCSWSMRRISDGYPLSFSCMKGSKISRSQKKKSKGSTIATRFTALVMRVYLEINAHIMQGPSRAYKKVGINTWHRTLTQCQRNPSLIPYPPYQFESTRMIPMRKSTWHEKSRNGGHSSIQHRSTTA